MATAVLVIVCVVHRRRRRSRQQRKSAEQRRQSADALAAAAVDGVPAADCVKDGSVEVRYVGRSANCTPTHAAGNSVTSSRNPAGTTSRAGSGKRLLKEKTEKVSIV